MLAWLVALETALLAAIALEYGRIQIQRGAECRPRELAKTRRTPAPLQVSHDRHQPAPATHWFAGVAQFQTGRRTPKDATLLSHRSVPPSVLVESCKTQLYQRAQNDAQLLFSTNGVFRFNRPMLTL